MLRRVSERPRNYEVSSVRGKCQWWEGFTKKVDFEPGMKDRGSYG